MSPELIGAIAVIILLILLFVGMWLGTAMLLVGFLGYWYLVGLKPALAVIGNLPFSTLTNYTFSCIPLFLLMGVVIANTRMGEDMYMSANKLVGQMRGGLAIATVLACAIFAAITGSSMASVVTMGKVAIPEMKRYKYDDSLAGASVACAGTLAVLIPPSVVFIVYGLLTENSVANLFMAGFFPGLVLVALFIISIVIVTRINPASGPRGEKTTFKTKILSTGKLWHVVLLFAIVLGGIYGGIFTPTEAAGIGAFGALVIALIGRRLTLKIFTSSILDTAQTTAMIGVIIIGAFIFMKFLAISRLPNMLSTTLLSLNVEPMFILIGIIVLYIILGMFLDVMSVILLTVPIFYTPIVALGFDPLLFGVIVVVVSEMGVVTPPIGMNVFILSGVTKIPNGVIFRGIVPFVVSMLVLIILLLIFPQIALFLPYL